MCHYFDSNPNSTGSNSNRALLEAILHDELSQESAHMKSRDFPAVTDLVKNIAPQELLSFHDSVVILPTYVQKSDGIGSFKVSGMKPNPFNLRYSFFHRS